MTSAKSKKKSLVLCLLACAFAAMFLLPASAAIEIDGIVGNLEWADCPRTELIRVGEESMCGITDATVRSAVQRGDPNRVVLGFTAHAPDITEQSPIGAALFVAGQRIARWQQGAGVEYDAENYSLRGAASVPENDALSSFSFELELGCKTAAALQALSALQVQLYDPQGEPSRRINYPIAAPAVETTVPTTTTTAKETTTKAPTTTKETTTKPPTTAKETTATVPPTTKESTTTQTTTTTTTTTATTKATTAARTTEPPYTIPPGWATSAAKQQAISSAVTTVSAAAPAQGAQAPALPATTAPRANAPTQPQQARQSSSKFWYTVMITDTTADAALWTYAPVREEAYVAQTELTAVQFQQAQSQPAAQRGWLFYGLAALLFALVLVMIVFWLRAQRAEQAKEKEEP